MWLSLILVSFFYGITGKNITLYLPYFESNTFHSFILEDNLSYSLLFKPDILRGIWTLNDSSMITKVPVLDASSLKQRDSSNLITISFVTPVVNTSHKIMIEASSYGNNTYNTHYAATYAFSYKSLKAQTFLLRTSTDYYLNSTTLSSSRLLFETENVLKNRLKLSKNRALYGKSTLKIGAFYWQNPDAYYGITGILKYKRILANIYISITDPVKPFYNAWFRHSFLNLYIERDLKYDINYDTTRINNRGILTLTPDGLYTAIWINSGMNDTTYGLAFLLEPSPLLNGGFILSNSQNTSHASLILSSEQSFYNGELQLSLLLKFKNMKYLYYSVEILLFRNLVLRKLKSENGDFIGIFVRLIN